VASSDRAAVVGGVNLLERSMSYAFGSLVLATDDVLSRPTPCPAWDVRALLVHMGDGIAAIADAAETGQVSLSPDEVDRSAASLVASVRRRGRRLLGAWASAADPAVVSVAGRELPNIIVAAAGAIEIAAHGWDLARGCGADRPVPAALAAELLELAPVIVTAADRPARFAPVVVVAATAPVSDRLIGFLGRDPD
jgi:uncharacterized protein (TIGR03086 family)